MARVAKAAQQLLDQVGGSVVGDQDGFGVYRSVVVPFVKAQRVLDPGEHRVRSLARLGDELFVTFVAGTAADHTEPFDLG